MNNKLFKEILDDGVKDSRKPNDNLLYDDWFEDDTDDDVRGGYDNALTRVDLLNNDELADYGYVPVFDDDGKQKRDTSYMNPDIAPWGYDLFTLGDDGRKIFTRYQLSNTSKTTNKHKRSNALSNDKEYYASLLSGDDGAFIGQDWLDDSEDNDSVSWDKEGSRALNYYTPTVEDTADKKRARKIPSL